MKVFIIECPNPIDLLRERAEYQSLEKVCKLMGHDSASFLVKSKQELITVIKYISTIDAEHDEDDKKNEHLCIHLSTHGNRKGLVFGTDFLDWDDLAMTLEPLYNLPDYPGNLILIISSCGTNQQKFTLKIKNKIKDTHKPPQYLFVFDEEKVHWNDAVLGWTILYHQLPKINLDNKTSVQAVLKRIKQASLGNIKYYRWDNINLKYKKYIVKDTD